MLWCLLLPPSPPDLHSAPALRLASKVSDLGANARRLPCTLRSLTYRTACVDSLGPFDGRSPPSFLHTGSFAHHWSQIDSHSAVYSDVRIADSVPCHPACLAQFTSRCHRSFCITSHCSRFLYVLHSLYPARLQICLPVPACTTHRLALPRSLSFPPSFPSFF